MTSRGRAADDSTPTTPSGPTGPGGVVAVPAGTAVFAMLAASFIGMFDRSTMPPMLTTIASDLSASIGDVGGALSVLAIAYAISQVAWSAISSRIGQVRVLRIALIAGAVFTLLTAFAVNPAMLWIGRALTGLSIGAIIPATLVYVGDNIPLKHRAHTLANLATATSLGLTAAIVIASVFGPLGAWRWVFVGTAVAELVIGLLLFRVKAGARPSAPVPVMRSLRRLLVDGWNLLILGLVFIEGAMLFGVMGFLPTALHDTGTDATLAGVVTGVYGITLIGTAQLMKLVLGRIPPALLLLIGGSASVIGFALIAAVLSVVTVLIASALFGFAWAIAHTQMQNWMTDAVAKDRPVGTALFATALFAGGALGAAVGSWSATGGWFQLLFLLTAVSGLLFAIAASFGRARYRVRAA